MVNRLPFHALATHLCALCASASLVILAPRFCYPQRGNHRSKRVPLLSTIPRTPCSVATAIPSSTRTPNKLTPLVAVSAGHAPHLLLRRVPRGHVRRNHARMSPSTSSHPILPARSSPRRRREARRIATPTFRWPREILPITKASNLSTQARRAPAPPHRAQEDRRQVKTLYHHPKTPTRNSIGSPMAETVLLQSGNPITVATLTAPSSRSSAKPSCATAILLCSPSKLNDFGFRGVSRKNPQPSAAPRISHFLGTDTLAAIQLLKSVLLGRISPHRTLSTARRQHRPRAFHHHRVGRSP